MNQRWFVPEKLYFLSYIDLLDYRLCDVMLEKVLDLKKSMFLTDTSEDMDAYFRYINRKKKKHRYFFEVDTPRTETNQKVI